MRSNRAELLIVHVLSRIDRQAIQEKAGSAPLRVR